MYHVIGTAVTVTLLYIISFLFYRAGIYSQGLHRKLWNSILALAFLFTASAGIFKALQINFKWDIPIIESLLKWHVEIGVILGVTGFFHFLWHLPYFRTIFNESTDKDPVPVNHVFDSSAIPANLFMIGFTSTSVQILLMREMMIFTGGYELISGVFLGSWLIASSWGATLANKSSLVDIRKINLIFGLSPFISLIIMGLLSKLFLSPGEVPSILEAMIFTLIILTPFCLVSGFAFVKLLNLGRSATGFQPGKSFSIETTGGIVAGLLLSLLTSGLFNTYELLLIIVLMFIAYATLTFLIQKKKWKIAAKLFFILAVSAIVISDPDKYVRQLMIRAVEVRETKDTPYGNLTKGEYYGEPSLYYNQRLLSYSHDAIEREEDIHYAMLQRASHKNVLLVSGSPGSHIPEILKYEVRTVYYVERDPELALMAESGMVGKSEELIIENKDAFSYVRNSDVSFDAIIMLLPPPSTLSLNRFYTTEFFRNARLKMTQGGVFLCSPGPNDNYFNQESVKLYSSIFNSLNSVFKNVVPVAGNKLYFIASDEPLAVSFCMLAEERKISNEYVSEAYLDDDNIAKKSNEITEIMDSKIRPNRASFPVATFHFQSYNFSKNVKDKVPAIIIIALIFVLPGFTVRRKNVLMYFSASALAGIEIISLLAIQLTAGNMYQLTGLVFAAMMAGLAAGAGTRKMPFKKADIRLQALVLVIYFIILALFFDKILHVKGVLIAVLIILPAVVLPSWLTGHIFQELTAENSDPSGAAATYSADLSGSALGFIFISGLAIPVFGIRNSIICLSVLIIAGLIFGKKVKK